MLKLEIILNHVDYEKIIEKMENLGNVEKGLVKLINQAPPVIKNNALAAYVSLNKKSLTDKINHNLHNQRLDIKVKDIRIQNLNQ